MAARQGDWQPNSSVSGTPRRRRQAPCGGGAPAATGLLGPHAPCTPLLKRLPADASANRPSRRSSLMVSARSRERLHRSTLLMVGGVILRASGLRERPTLTLLPFASRALLPSPSGCVALALFYRTTPGTIGCVECEQGSPPTPPNPGPRAEVSSSARKLARSFRLRAHPAFFAPHTASDRPVRRLPAMLATVACPLWILCLLLGWAQALSGHAGSTLAAPEHSPIQRGCVSLGAGSLLHFRAAADGDCEGALVAPPPPPPPAKSSALGLLNMALPPAACRNPFHGRPPML